MFGVLRGARNPVLAHLFLNYLLDPDVALTNFAFNYYQQPLTAMMPELLVEHGLIPKTLDSTISARRNSGAASCRARSRVRRGPVGERVGSGQSDERGRLMSGG